LIGNNLNQGSILENVNNGSFNKNNPPQQLPKSLLNVLDSPITR